MNMRILIEISAFLTLGLLTLLMALWMRRNFAKALRKKGAHRSSLEADLARLVEQSRDIQDDHTALSRRFDETAALHDLATEITKYLDEERVFTAFSERLARYIRFTDCKYFKDTLEPGYDRSLTLSLGGKTVGYLAASGISAEDAEKFHIMGEQFLLGIKRAILYRKVSEMATYDALTRVYTRRYWFERGRQEIERSKRFKLTACCLMADVDKFKDINDRYGHLVGDAILVEVAKILRESIRQIDLLGKYGGEEFCVLLTETDLENASYVAERIRAAIDQRRFRVYDEELRVTVSLGVAVSAGGAVGLEQLIDASDQALYRAKQEGRNRVCTAK